jgi:hypothetical protein
VVISKLPVENSLPAFDTHIPFVGTIDLNQPAELAFWGGLAFNLLFISGFSKWVIAAGILAARYEYDQYKRRPK